MSVITVSATVEASNNPPRVRLNVTDIGSPNLFAATVTRLDPDGRVVPVRTQDGNPLVLTTSGSNRVGTLYDYEMPFGQPVTYSTQESPTTTSAEVTVPEDQVWLIHPGIPELSMQVELQAGSLSDEVYPVRQGVHYAMGRANPIVVTDGTRGGMQSSLAVWVDTLQDVARIRSLVWDAGVLLLNVPPSLGYGVDTAYIMVSDVTIARPSTVGSDQQRSVQMPFVVVDRPAGGSQAERTYVDLLAYPTYAALAAAYNSYLDLLAGP